MAKAHKPPAAHRPRYRYVSDHAVQRMRERVVDLDLEHRIDQDLVRLIDDVVERSTRTRGNVRGIVDNGKPARIVDITAELDATARTFALLKPNLGPRGGPPIQHAEAVVTILDEAAYVAMSARKGWEQPKERNGGLMAQKLKAAGFLSGGVPSVTIRRAAPSSTEAKEAAGAAEGDQGEGEAVAEEPTPEHYMIEVAAAGGVREFHEYEIADPDELERAAIALLTESPGAEIFIWKRTGARVKVSVTIEGL